MAKPKALVFYTYLPPWRIDVFNEMAKSYDLTIIFLNANSPGFTYNRDLLLSKLKVDCLFWNKGFSIGSKAFRFGIFGLIKKYKPDIVFTHEYSPTSILLAIYLKLHIASYKLVVTTSDNRVMAENVKGLKKFFRKYILDKAKGVVVYSDNVKNWYQATFKRIKVEVCPNIQDPDSILKHKDKLPALAQQYIQTYSLTSNVALYVGRLEKMKGLDLLFEAFSKSIKNTHQLVLVGEGSQKAELLKLASFYNIENRVIFAGYFDDINLYAWYYLADFFVLPSRYEPFGAVVNESLVLGCPVLASKNIGALDYISNGKNGLIFDPENKFEFATALTTAGDMFKAPAGYNRVDLMIRSFTFYIKAFVDVVN